MAPRKKTPAEKIDDLLKPPTESEQRLAATRKKAAAATKRKNAAQTRRVGRPSKYQSRYASDLIKYFQVEHLVFSNYTDKGARQDFADYDFPTFEGFAAKLMVHLDTLHEWGSVHPEFSEALRVARAMQADIIKKATARNIFPPNFAALLLSNDHGYQTQAKQAARAKSAEEGEKGGDDLPEATAFRLVVVRDRDDAHYQLWCDAREKAKLRGNDVETAGDDFLLYDDADAEQLKEVAKVKGHLLGLLEMLGDD